MAVLIGTSDTTNYATTTNTYSSANGEWYYAVTASQTGTANTLKIRMSSFNTTTNLKLVVRATDGTMLASGTIASSGGDSGERSVSVSDFSVTSGTSYLLCILPNTGSPRPMQNTTTGTTYSQSASTYASTQSTLTVPGTLSGAVRQYHFWVEGILPVPTVTDINTTETIVAGSSGNTLTCVNFSGTINSITVGGKACTSISGAGTSYTFTMPGYIHAQAYPNPNGSVSLVATDNLAGTDDISVTMSPPAGYSCVTIASPITNNSRYMGYCMAANGFTPVNGDKMLTLDADCTGSADTGISASAEVVTTIWHWVLATETMYEYTVTVNNAGVVSAGITAASITATSITSAGLTSRSL